MNQKPNDALDNPQNYLWVYDGQRDTYWAISAGRVKALLEGTIPHPGQEAGTVVEGTRPVGAMEQMLVADPYWLEMCLEMMWNNGSALIDSANPPGRQK
jgi:hypothetical protein